MPPERIWPYLVEPEKAMAWSIALGDFLKSYDERWVIDPTESGSRLTFNDHVEFPYGPIGKLIGFFASRSSQKVGAEVLQNLKSLVEADARGES